MFFFTKLLMKKECYEYDQVFQRSYLDWLLKERIRNYFGNGRTNELWTGSATVFKRAFLGALTHIGTYSIL